jgi:hypothetical protein
VFERATPDTVTQVPIPAAGPVISVAATAQADGVQIAVGSADGYPAIWRRQIASGQWSPWSLVTSPGQFGQAAPGTLTSITHGPSAWLAVGSGHPHGLTMTSPDGATWRVA